MGEPEVREEVLEPDPSDTGSWLVEELAARGADTVAAPISDDHEDWGVGIPRDAGQGLRHDDQPEGDEDPVEIVDENEHEDEDAQPDLEEASVEAPDLAAIVDELRRDIARATVDLDRLSGRIAEEVATQLDQREEELALRASAGEAELKAAVSAAEQRILEQIGSAIKAQRDLAEKELGATAAQLRSELSDAEKRLGTQFVEEIRSHVKAMERKREAVTAAVDALTGRLDGLEERLRSVAAETDGISATLAVVSRYRAPGPDAGDEPTGLDLNAADFEDLRRIGLSSTQAARVLSHRDASGGYDSVERLHEVPGLPHRLVERIRPRVIV